MLLHGRCLAGFKPAAALEEESNRLIRGDNHTTPRRSDINARYTCALASSLLGHQRGYDAVVDSGDRRRRLRQKTTLASRVNNVFWMLLWQSNLPSACVLVLLVNSLHYRASGSTRTPRSGTVSWTWWSPGDLISAVSFKHLLLFHLATSSFSKRTLRRKLRRASTLSNSRIPV